MKVQNGFSHPQTVNYFKPNATVGIDPARNSIPLNTNGTTPLNMLIDAKTLKVLEKFNGFQKTTTINLIKKHLTP